VLSILYVNITCHPKSTPDRNPPFFRHDNDGLLRKTWKENIDLNILALEIVGKAIGDVPLITTLGNNDVEFHDQLPYYG
jgi:hypothetical protein